MLVQKNLPFQRDKLLKDLSTFEIGGRASYFVEVSFADQLALILPFLAREKIPYLILGKGSNVLFDDRGYNGVVILNKIISYQKKEDVLSVGAGYSFSLLGMRTARESLSGLEFAAGIPATVGGALFMNAGAGADETCNPLVEVTYVTEEGEKLSLSKKNLNFGYRFSSFQQMKGAIVGAKFRLTPSEEAQKRVQAIISRRLLTQPCKERSAGCVFRNPASGPSAGWLIDQAGLKGRAIGGAEVSTIHANFIINRGNATAHDVLSLAELIQRVVKEKSGVLLEREIHYIPFSSYVSR
ncbi:MAG: UDP-N-acetylenolpyruvoylglucosamine reductase [Chlamydiae bacterium RIFCSPLOWO2_12_FULL_49_12]|nr:MAG: UDP-N-acetylenolpyruvoylglucosamine reductase [Chlamydiae bacterium RIFCSPHIGHO2_02_FULL_49_29]OGN72847.1 MAG: UDP-N-acetylenolpyruvoylglucosamine reductase [Chlamydiae bacterium RIFCSPLOWO2_12_FULL_49_12]